MVGVEGERGTLREKGKVVDFRRGGRGWLWGDEGLRRNFRKKSFGKREGIEDEEERGEI